jgi:hypothetical protein
VLLALGSLEIYELGFEKAGPSVLLGLLWISCPFLFFRSRVKKDFERHPNLSREYSLHVDGSGIRLTNELSETGGKWPVYVKFQETRNLFMLYYGTRMFLIVPKRIFAGTELDQFRELISRNISSK